MRGLSPWSRARDGEGSASQRAYDAIRRMILHGELSGGAIGEEEVSRSLRLSRTPVREALQALLRDGLIVEARRRQVVVTVLTDEDIDEILELRDACEQMALESACLHNTVDQLDRLRLNLIQQRRAAKARDVPGFLDLDDDFHVMIASESGRRVTAEFARQLRGFVRLALLRTSTDPDIAQALFQHEELVDAIEDGNAAVAHQRLADHLAITRALLTRELDPGSREHNPHSRGLLAPSTNEGGSDVG